MIPPFHPQLLTSTPASLSAHPLCSLYSLYPLYPPYHHFLIPLLHTHFPIRNVSSPSPAFQPYFQQFLSQRLLAPPYLYILNSKPNILILILILIFILLPSAAHRSMYFNMLCSTSLTLCVTRPRDSTEGLIVNVNDIQIMQILFVIERQANIGKLSRKCNAPSKTHYGVGNYTAVR